MKVLYFIFILLHFVTLNASGQEVSMDSMKKPDIVRHNTNSTLPDTLHVTGYLVDKPSPGYCGFICMGGTIKVRLTKKIPGYTNDFVYIVTACLSHGIKRNTKIAVIASKLKTKEPECYYNSIMNGFDSGGLPFYKLSEKETAKIHD